MSTENQQINLHVKEGENEVIIRHGEAEPVAGFRKGITVSGTLGVPREHLEKPSVWLTARLDPKVRKEDQDPVLNFSHLQVNRDKGTITFTEDAGNEWENKYIGALVFDPRFEKFGINSGRSYTTIELSHFIKMNRSHFETKDKAMLLVSQLRDFKAKVDKQVENMADERGNRRILQAQAVESNIPESFHITVPVFKGCAAQTLEVEIAIDPGDLSCTLISPEVNDYVENVKNEIINEEIRMIEESHPTLRIFEV